MTLTEILTKSLLNTMLGMGTVFAVLIFMSFLISLFKYIPGIIENFKSRIAKDTATNQMPLDEPLVVNDKNEKGTLVAVITASIAASMAKSGASGDDYVVRAIRRI